MNRRKLLKSISFLTGAAILSPKHLLADTGSQKLHYVGIGDGGCKMIEYLLNEDKAINYTVINSSFKGYRFLADKQVSFELPTNAYEGRNINLGTLRILKELPESIKSIFSDEDKHYFIFAGLGGFTGSYLSKKIGYYLQTANVSHTSLLTLPFTFEGKIKRQQAELIKSSFDNLSKTNFYDFDELRKKHGNFKMVDAFEIANKYEFEIYKRYVQTVS